MKMIRRKWTKKFKKIDDWNHHTEDKREGQTKANGRVAHKNQKKERGSPSHGRKLSHP